MIYKFQSLRQIKKRDWLIQHNFHSHYNSLKNKGKISDYSDEELLQAFRESNDMKYFAELYTRFVPKLYGLCLKYLADREAARDAVMDVFQQLPEKIAQYEIANFNSWLYSVAKNHCFSRLKKENQVYFVKMEDAVVENDTFFSHNDKPQSEEEMEALEYCIETLTDEQKTSVKLFYLENRSYADICDMTGFALSKVKSYIQNGKRNLKSCILKVLKNNN